jgi:hypothetical protein
MRAKWPMKKKIIACLAIVGLMMIQSSARADELCPDVTKGEASLTVSDMAGLQFDIGRLNLCVQRARLLQQIDEIVKKREQIRQEPMALSPISGSMGMIPPLAAPLPPLPSEQTMKQALQKTQASDLGVVSVKAPQGEWKIQRIWGQGQVMQAQLVKGDVIANIKRGDTLPSGEKVAELSGKGVVLDNGKGQQTLNWLEDHKTQ